MQNKIEEVQKKLTTTELLFKLTGKDMNSCPCFKGVGINSITIAVATRLSLIISLRNDLGHRF